MDGNARITNKLYARRGPLHRKFICTRRGPYKAVRLDSLLLPGTFSCFQCKCRMLSSSIALMGLNALSMIIKMSRNAHCGFIRKSNLNERSWPSADNLVGYDKVVNWNKPGLKKQISTTQINLISASSSRTSSNGIRWSRQKENLAVEEKLATGAAVLCQIPKGSLPHVYFVWHVQ